MARFFFVGSSGTNVPSPLGATNNANSLRLCGVSMKDEKPHMKAPLAAQIVSSNLTLGILGNNFGSNLVLAKHTAYQ